MPSAFEVVDADTGKEVCRGDCNLYSVATGGNGLITSDSEHRLKLSDMPPRKPIKRFLLLSGAFSLAIFLLIAFNRIVSRISNKRRSATAGHSLANTSGG